MCHVEETTVTSCYVGTCTLTARELPCLIHGFSPVNARLLMTCGTVFYAIMKANHNAGS